MDDYSIQTLRAFFLFRDLEKGEQDRLFAGLPEPAGYEKGEILFSRACFRKAALLCAAERLAQLFCQRLRRDLEVGQRGQRHRRWQKS